MNQVDYLQERYGRGAVSGGRGETVDEESNPESVAIHLPAAKYLIMDFNHIDSEWDGWVVMCFTSCDAADPLGQFDTLEAACDAADAWTLERLEETRKLLES